MERERTILDRAIIFVIGKMNHHLVLKLRIPIAPDNLKWTKINGKKYSKIRQTQHFLINGEQRYWTRDSYK